MAHVFIILGSVAAALAALVVVGRFSTPHGRKQSNDFTGALLGLIGTTYAVILAFLLAGLWTHYQQAKADAQLEAADVVNIFRVARQLPVENRRQIQDLAFRYADTVLNTEWPEMLNGEVPHGGGALINELWEAVTQMKGVKDNQAIAMGQLMTSLSALTQHRGIRVMETTDALPGILWVVLIGGGVITVLAACLFGVENFRFHLLQIAVLSFLISLVLVAIAAVDRPYQGEVRVSADGFQYALRTINEERTP